MSPWRPRSCVAAYGDPQPRTAGTSCAATRTSAPGRFRGSAQAIHAVVGPRGRTSSSNQPDRSGQQAILERARRDQRRDGPPTPKHPSPPSSTSRQSRSAPRGAPNRCATPSWSSGGRGSPLSGCAAATRRARSRGRVPLGRDVRRWSAARSQDRGQRRRTARPAPRCCPACATQRPTVRR